MVSQCPVVGFSSLGEGGEARKVWEGPRTHLACDQDLLLPNILQEHWGSAYSLDKRKPRHPEPMFKTQTARDQRVWIARAL